MDRDNNFIDDSMEIAQDNVSASSTSVSSMVRDPIREKELEDESRKSEELRAEKERATFDSISGSKGKEEENQKGIFDISEDDPQESLTYTVAYNSTFNFDEELAAGVALEDKISFNTASDLEIEEEAIKIFEASNSDCSFDDVTKIFRKGVTEIFIEEGEFLENKHSRESLTDEEQTRLTLYKDFKHSYLKHQEKVFEESLSRTQLEPTLPQAGIDEASANTEHMDHISIFQERLYTKAQLAGALLGRVTGLNRGNNGLESASKFLFKNFTVNKDKVTLSQSDLDFIASEKLRLGAEYDSLSAKHAENEDVIKDIKKKKKDSTDDALKFKKLYFIKLLAYGAFTVGGFFLVGIFFGITPQQIASIFPNINISPMASTFSGFTSQTANANTIPTATSMKTYIEILTAILLDFSRWGFDK